MTRRSGEAIAALSRNSAGPMKHRLQGRGGARNQFAEYMEEYGYELYELEVERSIIERRGAQPEYDGRYQDGFFKTQPTHYGAIPRLCVAIARKSPDNGWAWYALAFGRFVCFDEYLPELFSMGH